MILFDDLPKSINAVDQQAEKVMSAEDIEKQIRHHEQKIDELKQLAAKLRTWHQSQAVKLTQIRQRTEGSDMPATLVPSEIVHAVIRDREDTEHYRTNLKAADILDLARRVGKGQE